MGKYELTCGVQQTALRVVAYGHEGIGKSTFAAQMPGSIFIDVEGGTNQLPVARLPKPTSWTMLMDEVRSVRDGQVPECGTLVIDTADAAEVLCIRHVCAKEGKEGLEDFGYGKGYTYAEEEFGRLLDTLTEVTEKGRNVVMLSHAIMRKFERPDESGAYDRFELKLSRKVAPKVKEWCDMLLFLDYKTFVSTDSNGKAKASGGERVIRTTHEPTWDAKNRFGLPDCIKLDADNTAKIAALLVGGDELPKPETKPAPVPEPAPITVAEPKPMVEDAPTDQPPYPARLDPLWSLMVVNGVTDHELRSTVAAQGYFPYECKVEDYPQEFADWLVSVWDSFMSAVEKNRN